jgi:hypothetical protein
MAALTEVNPRDREAWLSSLVGRESFRVYVSGRRVDAEAALRVLATEVEAFRANKLAKMIELGILSE